MLCSLLKNCILKITNIDQPGREPVFKSLGGSTDNPGQSGYINYGQLVAAYEVFIVPADRIFVLEHVSAVVTRGGNLPYPPGYMGDYGAVGYTLGTGNFFHTISFTRREPEGVLQASHSLRLYIPSNARVIVKVPLIPNQSGGADTNVSGYYLTA
jgi:hypothetical protein